MFGQNADLGFSPMFGDGSTFQEASFDRIEDSPSKQHEEDEEEESIKEKREASRETKQRKILKLLEDYKSQKMKANSSLNIDSPDEDPILKESINITKNLLINKVIEEGLFGEYEKLDSGLKEFRFFIHALDENKSDNMGLTSELEMPESYIRDSSRNTVNGTKYSRHPHENSEYYIIADPLSLSNTGLPEMNHEEDHSQRDKKKKVKTASAQIVASAKLIKTKQVTSC